MRLSFGSNVRVTAHDDHRGRVLITLLGTTNVAPEGAPGEGPEDLLYDPYWTGLADIEQVAGLNEQDREDEGLRWGATAFALGTAVGPPCCRRCRRAVSFPVLTFLGIWRRGVVLGEFGAVCRG